MTENIYSNDDTVLSITKITSKFIYSMLLSKITEEATAKRKLFNIYSDRNIDDLWKNACLNIYESSIDTYARYFQFKILHNYLAVNKNLYKWKLIDSPRCNYCKTDIESIKHLFCECHVTRTFYLNVKEWCKNFNVNLPEMNAIDVLYGVSPDNIENALINTLLLIYKQIVYQC